MGAELKTLEPIAVIGIDHRGPYNTIGGVYGRLGQLAGQHGWPVQGSLGIFYDDPREVPESELRSTACMIVPEGFEAGVAGIRSFSVEGGQYAVLRHVGPYEALGDKWMQMYAEELPKLGVQDAGPPFEVYVSHPAEGSAEPPVTDIHVPVKPR